MYTAHCNIATRRLDYSPKVFGLFSLDVRKSLNTRAPQKNLKAPLGNFVAP